MREMKDSRIEWIGQIPSTWRINKRENSKIVFANQGLENWKLSWEWSTKPALSA